MSKRQGGLKRDIIKKNLFSMIDDVLTGGHSKKTPIIQNFNPIFSYYKNDPEHPAKPHQTSPGDDNLERQDSHILIKGMRMSNQVNGDSQSPVRFSAPPTVKYQMKTLRYNFEYQDDDISSIR
jgi:hypothetical protein